MPKRIIDGEGLWRSDKLALVQPAWIKAEFANLVPLAYANGTFEVNTRLIWSTVYSYNRPEISLDAVEQILTEFERVKLLFRWRDEVTGKDWGYWIGIDKVGRLPPLTRLKGRHEKVGPEPPSDKLGSFLGGLPMASHGATKGHPEASLGFGFGFGTGFGNGDGQPMASHECAREPFNSTEVAQILCQQNGWSGTSMIWAVRAAIEFQSKQNPESDLTQIGEWLVKAYQAYKATKGIFAVVPQKFFEQGLYCSAANHRESNVDLLADNPATRALAQMVEGD